MAEPRALAAGGRFFRLPPGATALPPAPLRPLPLGMPGLLGIALRDGEALPVLAAAPGLTGGPAWVLLDSAAGRLVVAGEALTEEAPPEAEPLAIGLVAGAPAPRPALPPVLPAEGSGGWALPPRHARSLPVAMAAELGPVRLVLPFAALEHVVEMPPLRPAPGAGLEAQGGGPAQPLTLGLALAEGAPVLVLDPARLAELPPVAEAPTHLAVFRHAGRRLGLPCARLGPAEPGEAPLTQRLDALLPTLGPAPLGAAAAPPPPEPMRSLLLCMAGGQPFALPVEEVAAAIPPIAPAPAPAGVGRGICGVIAHRGEVLPVLDGGERLGLPPVLPQAGAEAPMLRLTGPRPVALAVSQVTGLRQVPERLVVATAGDGPVAAVAALQDGPVVICRAAILGDAEAALWSGAGLGLGPAA